MKKFIGDVLASIRKNNMIRPGDHVIAGFSGGADSTALLLSLMQLRSLLKCSVSAVHVNHGIRGQEAERDERFCREFCAGRGIVFEAVYVDVPGYAAKTGTSIEEAARILRYGALQQEAEKQKALSGRPALIAVAHHAGDQAETILMNMLRGSGLKGLGGMRPVRGNIIRPLLETERSEIIGFLESEKAGFVTDSTNLSNDYTRNFLRREIMPRLKECVNERAAGHICSTGETALLADEYFTARAREFLSVSSEMRFPENGRVLLLNRKELKEKEQIIRRYVIIESLRSVGVHLKDWGEKHFSDIDRALFKGSGHHLDLPGGVCCDNSYSQIAIFVPENYLTVTIR